MHQIDDSIRVDDEGTIILSLSTTDTIPDINSLVTSEDLAHLSSEDVFDTDSR